MEAFQMRICSLGAGAVDLAMGRMLLTPSLAQAMSAVREARKAGWGIPPFSDFIHQQGEIVLAGGHKLMILKRQEA